MSATLKKHFPWLDMTTRPATFIDKLEFGIVLAALGIGVGCEIISLAIKHKSFDVDEWGQAEQDHSIIIATGTLLCLARMKSREIYVNSFIELLGDEDHDVGEGARRILKAMPSRYRESIEKLMVLL